MNEKKLKAFARVLVLGVLLESSATVAMAGAIDGGEISKLYLLCNNNHHPSVSYGVQVISGFFEVDGKKEWTTGADIYRSVHFANHAPSTLIKSSAVTVNDSFTNIKGDGFSLVQSGPGNFNMKTFPATLTLDEVAGNQLTVSDLECQIH